VDYQKLTIDLRKVHFVDDKIVDLKVESEFTIIVGLKQSIQILKITPNNKFWRVACLWSQAMNFKYMTVQKLAVS